MQSRAPLISVVLWSDNHADFLAASVMSLRLQTWAATEIVILDNASTDGSREIAMSLAAEDSTIHFFPLTEPTLRLAAERSIVSQLNGEFIAFASSGSRSLPTRLEAGMNQLLTTPNLGCVCSRIILEDDMGNIVEDQSLAAINDGDIILRDRLMREGEIIDVDTALFRRRFLENMPASLVSAEASGHLPLWLYIADDSELLRIDEFWVKRLATCSEQRQQASFGDSAGPVASIIDAFRRWPLERLFPFKNPPGSLDRRHEEAVAEARIALQLLELDRHFFGKPALGCEEAQRRALRACELSPNCLEASEALALARQATSDRPFIAPEPTQPLEIWKASSSGIIPQKPQQHSKATASCYQQWAQKHALREIDGEFFGEHIAQFWQYRPTFIVLELPVAATTHKPAARPLSDRLATQLYAPAAGGTAAPGDTLRKLLAAATDIGDAWVLLLPHGAYLAPETLIRVGDAIHLNPDARLIYADDEITSDVHHTTSSPRFKPDFDELLLKSQDYLGAVIVHIPTALDLAADILIDSEIPRHLAATIAKARGRKAISHITELLFSLPPDALSNSTQAQQPPPQPRISLSLFVVQPPDESDDFRPEQDKDLAFWNDWARTHSAETIPIVASTDLGISINHAATTAMGEILIFVGAASRPSDTNWPWAGTTLIVDESHGAVGCGAKSPDDGCYWGTGVVMGMGACFGYMHGHDARPGDEGHIGRACHPHEISAVGADGLITSRTQFISIGGFDPAWHLPELMAVDYCLRLREARTTIAWTPHALLLRPTQTIQGLNPSQQELCSLQDRFIDRWKHILGCDPYWNPHLSLTVSTPQPEHDLVFRWHPVIHDRLRILALPMPASGQAEYRVTAPLRALENHGMAQTLLACEPIPGLERAPIPSELLRLKPDTLLLQAAFDDVRLAGLRASARFMPELFRVFTIDDRAADMPSYNELKANVPRDLLVSRMREALSLCHRMIVSTEPLAEHHRRDIDDIVVIPNRLERARWGHIVPAVNTGNKPRIGWAGALQHRGDLAIIQEVVETLADEVDWIFFGMIPAGCERYVKEFHGVVRLDDYPAKLASLALDLALAPLEVNLFNESKSNLRLLEYGIFGWPVICSDIDPFRTNNAPVCRLPNHPEMWISAIREHLNDPHALQQTGRQLQEWVYRHYILEDHLEQWLQALTPSQICKASPTESITKRQSLP